MRIWCIISFSNNLYVMKNSTSHKRASLSYPEYWLLWCPGLHFYGWDFYDRVSWLRPYYMILSYSENSWYILGNYCVISKVPHRSLTLQIRRLQLFSWSGYVHAWIGSLHSHLFICTSYECRFVLLLKLHLDQPSKQQYKISFSPMVTTFALYYFLLLYKDSITWSSLLHF